MQSSGLVNPLHIGPKLGLPAQVEREVHAQPGKMGVGLRCRVDQVRKRHTARTR